MFLSKMCLKGAILLFWSSSFLVSPSPIISPSPVQTLQQKEAPGEEDSICPELTKILCGYESLPNNIFQDDRPNDFSWFCPWLEKEKSCLVKEGCSSDALLRDSAALWAAYNSTCLKAEQGWRSEPGVHNQGEDSACNVSIVNSCYGSFPTKPVQNEDDLNLVCSLIGGVRSCLAKMGCLKSDDKALWWDGLMAVSNYTCGEARQAYLENVVCLTSAKLNATANNCLHPYLTRLSRSNFCSKTKAYLKCVTDAAWMCGPGGHYVYSMMRYKELSPLANSMGCYLDE